eukprot:s4226_g5.t7
MAEDSIKAIGFENGIFHVEGKYTSRGPRLLEVNARMGGGPVRKMQKHTFGVDLVVEQMFIAVGIPCNPCAADVPKKAVAYACCDAPRGGCIPDRQMFEAFKQREGILWVVPLIKPGDRVFGPEEGVPTWIAQILVESDDGAAAARDFALAVEQQVIDAYSKVFRGLGDSSAKLLPAFDTSDKSDIITAAKEENSQAKWAYSATDLQPRARRKGKFFTHGKEELRPSSLPDNIMARKQKDAEVMSGVKAAEAACAKGHRLKRHCARVEYECDACCAEIQPGSTVFHCLECGGPCVACSAQSTTNDRPATTVRACRRCFSLKLGDVIDLTGQHSPVECPELVRECEGRCAGFIGRILFPEALPTVVQMCLSEQNLAGACRALQLEVLLEIETDGELASRAAVASSFFMALFHASRRRGRGTACLLVAVEAMLDFVCLIGTSHFVAMGEEADVSYQTAELQAAQSEGANCKEQYEELVHRAAAAESAVAEMRKELRQLQEELGKRQERCDELAKRAEAAEAEAAEHAKTKELLAQAESDAAEKQLEVQRLRSYQERCQKTDSHPKAATTDEDSEEAARACRVQAQHERKSLVRWDHAGGVKEHRTSSSTTSRCTAFWVVAVGKGHVVQADMQENIMSERNVQLMCDSPFIIKLHATYNRPEHVCFLLEPALGGELHATYNYFWMWGHEACAKFYVAGAALGLEYLHGKKIVFRDLKPRNLLLSAEGYVKLADFSFAKVLPSGRTYSTCGTPNYLAPELLERHGHTHAVDWWALGILAYERMSGHPPFQSATRTQIYAKVWKGINAVVFPNKLNGDVQALVKVLCNSNPTERLPMKKGGIQNIKAQKWFEGFSWSDLESLSMKRPYVPSVTSKLDTTNFRAVYEEEMPPLIPYTEYEESSDSVTETDCILAASAHQPMLDENVRACDHAEFHRLPQS